LIFIELDLRHVEISIISCWDAFVSEDFTTYCWTSELFSFCKLRLWMAIKYVHTFSVLSVCSQYESFFEFGITKSIPLGLVVL